MVDISLKYTGGDLEKAKSMASGQYDDTTVIKARFLVQEKKHSGFFIVFINHDNDFISSLSSYISDNPGMFEKVRIFDDWKTLYKDIKALSSSEKALDTQDFASFLIASFIGFDIFSDVKSKDLGVLSKAVNEIIGRSYNAKNVQSQIELDVTSSLTMELAGIRIQIPGSAGSQVSEITAEALSREDELIKKIESEAEFIIEGKTIVSPVRGKYLSDISSGEKIKVLLTGGDLITERILKLLNAYDISGKPGSVTGRVKAKIPMEKGGYIVYTVVAKGVLAKLIEEENVKIQTDVVTHEIEKEEGTDNRLLIVMGILVGLIILAGIILLQML
jgi:hypothetical protein